MNDNIIHELENIVLKMNDQHNRLEKLVFGIKLNLIVCNNIEIKNNDGPKTRSLNKKIDIKTI